MWGGSIAQPFIDAGQVKELSAEYEAARLGASAFRRG